MLYVAEVETTNRRTAAVATHASAISNRELKGAAGRDRANLVSPMELSP